VSGVDGFLPFDVIGGCQTRLQHSAYAAAARIRISSGANGEPNSPRATLPGLRTVAQDLWLCARKNRTISADASGPVGSV
jgi:hypothetical protein